MARYFEPVPKAESFPAIRLVARRPGRPEQRRQTPHVPEWSGGDENRVTPGQIGGKEKGKSFGGTSQGTPRQNAGRLEDFSEKRKLRLGKDAAAQSAAFLPRKMTRLGAMLSLRAAVRFRSRFTRRIARSKPPSLWASDQSIQGYPGRGPRRVDGRRDSGKNRIPASMATLSRGPGAKLRLRSAFQSPPKCMRRPA